METGHLNSTFADQICSLPCFPVFLKIVETVVVRGIPRVGVAVAHECSNIQNWVSGIIHEFGHSTPTLRILNYNSTQQKLWQEEGLSVFPKGGKLIA